MSTIAFTRFRELFLLSLLAAFLAPAALGLAAEAAPEANPATARGSAADRGAASPLPTAAPENVVKAPARVVLTTSLGAITLELDAAKAPLTVENFLTYAQAGYFDGTAFHRVIPDFMVQGGGLLPDLSPKPGQRAAIRNEAGNGLKNVRGSVAMARTGDPDSATSQFFINLADNGFLDHRDSSPSGMGYAVFGKVVEGMSVVDKIAEQRTTSKGMHQAVPATPILIESVKLLAPKPG